jgi:DNA-binding MarR family transcriptional regulator
MTGPIPFDRIREAHDTLLTHRKPVPVYVTERLRVSVAPKPDNLSIFARLVATYTGSIALADLEADIQDEARALLEQRHANLLRTLRKAPTRCAELARRTGIGPSSLYQQLQCLERAGLVTRDGRTIDPETQRLSPLYRATTAEARHD